MQAIEFFVPGIPKPAGSKRAFYVPKLKRAVITDDCKTSKDWKADVKQFAKAAVFGDPSREPLSLDVLFVMPRPKSHYRTGKNSGFVRDDAPTFHTNKPDATKLLRAVEDAMTGIVWHDDSQIAQQRVAKVYGTRTGAHITVKLAETTNAKTE